MFYFLFFVDTSNYYFKILHSDILNFLFFLLGSKFKRKPKKEQQTKEDKKYKRRAKYFVVAQLVAVVLFLSIMSGISDDGEVELDDGDLDFGYDG